jgi:hypothetical protein
MEPLEPPKRNVPYFTNPNWDDEKRKQEFEIFKQGIKDQIEKNNEKLAHIKKELKKFDAGLMNKEQYREYVNWRRKIKVFNCELQRKLELLDDNQKTK